MRGHYLKRNAKNELPSRVLCVDTEALITSTECGERHSLRLGACYYIKRRGDQWDEKEFTFRTLPEFWALLDSLMMKGTTLYLIGHNMAYDYAILDIDNWLSSRDMDITQFVIGQAFIISANKNNMGIKIIDSMNWFKAPLRHLGKVFGLEKGEIEDFKNVSDSELMPYCMNDANIVKTVFLNYIDFIEKHDLGNFAVTSAGQAFNSFRHRFMREKSILIHANPGLYQLEQATYRGGRCDIFKQGKYDDIIKLDINSMYPFVMKKFDYPASPISQEPITDIDIPSVLGLIREGDKFLIGNFDIELNEPSIALKREKLIFPTGRLASVPLTLPEINYVLATGKLLKCHELALYTKENIFSGYVDFFYNIKSSAPPGPMRELSKLFLNSLYGKFGQREMGSISLDESPESSFILENDKTGSYWVVDGNEHYKVMAIGDKVYKVEPQKPTPGPQSSPIISSAVTSYARVYLWELMKLANIENVYYCDTDSIFTNKMGYDRLEAAGFIHNKELGKLKVEGIGSCVIRGPKDYDWFDKDTGKFKQTIKGVPASAESLGDNSFAYHQWETGLNRYHNRSSGEVNIKNSVKVLKRQYDKGFVDDQGLVHPFVLNEV